jgi:hypothetical protein
MLVTSLIAIPLFSATVAVTFFHFLPPPPAATQKNSQKVTVTFF